MKKILSTLTIIILFGIAMPTYGQQTKTHTWVAKVGPDGRNPGSVPWTNIIRYIKTNDEKTWSLQLNSTPEKFAIFCDSVWRTHAPSVSAAVDTTIKILSESHEEEYDSKIHGLLIEGNSGINKSTGKLEVIYTPIPEGAMILVHPRLGPVAKSDCNNPLMPAKRKPEQEKKLEPQRDVYTEPEEEIEYVYFDSIVPVPPDTLHNLTVITTAAKATQSTACTTCNVTINLNVKLSGLVPARTEMRAAQPAVQFVQPMQNYSSGHVNLGGRYLDFGRQLLYDSPRFSGSGGVNIYNNNSNRNDIHFTNPVVSNYFNNQQHQQTYTPPSSGGRLPGNPGTSIDCCGDTGRKPFR